MNVRNVEAPIIRYATMDDGREEFDEFIAHNATVHVEAMDGCSWWIGIEVGGRLWHINVGAKDEDAKGYATCEDVTAREL